MMEKVPAAVHPNPAVEELRRRLPSGLLELVQALGAHGRDRPMVDAELVRGVQILVPATNASNSELRWSLLIGCEKTKRIWRRLLQSCMKAQLLFAQGFLRGNESDIHRYLIAF